MACDRSRTTEPGPTAILAACWLLACAGNAGAVPSAAPTETNPGRTQTSTLGVIENAIHLLGDPSSDYRKVLLGAVAAIPANADDRARDDIRTFLTRAPEPGPEFRCSVDFVRSRARQDLLRLRDSLRNEYVAPAQPSVCYAVPFALELNEAQTTSGWLDIYGYDFDRVTPEMVLVGNEGYRDVTAALVARSHYHLALKLGEGGVRLSAENASLGLVWGHLIHYSVAIIQPASRLCSARIEKLPSGRTISCSPPRISREGPAARQGTVVRADATLDYASNKLEATVCMTAAVHAGGDAGSGGCTVEFLYTTDPDRVIEAVLGELNSRVSHVPTGRTRDVMKGTAHGPVGQWAFDGFPPGHSEGGAISVTARLNEIRLVTVEGEGCVSPLDYLEARRTTALDPVTRQALDPLLEGLDPDISRLRPRYSLPTENQSRAIVKTPR
jgi:hypothetical protein